MSSPGYDADSAALTAHAGTLAGLADELRLASDTSGRQSITDDAYGQTCRQFATLLDTLANAGQETLSAAAECLETESSNVRKAADAYAQQEDNAAGGFGQIGGELQ